MQVAEGAQRRYVRPAEGLCTGSGAPQALGMRARLLQVDTFTAGRMIACTLGQGAFYQTPVPRIKLVHASLSLSEMPFAKMRLRTWAAIKHAYEVWVIIGHAH
jgi:hypothetical protein